MNEKGFLSIYALFLCHIFLSFSAMILQKVKTNAVYGKETLSMAEIYAIHKAKSDLLRYEESEESVMFHEFEIFFSYDDITCYITIAKNGKILMESILEYDDMEECVIGYTYKE